MEAHLKERGILFSGEMVRAILAGRKTQTRRAMKFKTEYSARADITDIALALGCEPREIDRASGVHPDMQDVLDVCPYGGPGDRLWVRETWALDPDAHKDEAGVLYRATDPGWDESGSGLKWRPSIFMPRRASRITLEVEAVRAERLQDIDDAAALAEGVGTLRQRESTCYEGKWVEHFLALWDGINGKAAAKCWSANPWVWVVEFKRVENL